MSTFIWHLISKENLHTRAVINSCNVFAWFRTSNFLISFKDFSKKTCWHFFIWTDRDPTPIQKETSRCLLVITTGKFSHSDPLLDLDGKWKFPDRPIYRVNDAIFQKVPSSMTTLNQVYHSIICSQSLRLYKSWSNINIYMIKVKEFQRFWIQFSLFLAMISPHYPCVYRGRFM